jgi:hypothetical protein
MAGLFFRAIIPQVIPARGGGVWHALGHAALGSVIAPGWLTALAWASGASRIHAGAGGRGGIEGRAVTAGSPR